MFNIKEEIKELYNDLNQHHDNDITMLEKIKLLELYNEYDKTQNIIDNLRHNNDSSIIYYYDRQQEIINEIEDINSICYEDLEELYYLQEGISYV